MEPFVAEVEKAAYGNKPLVLFGSYDWGDGEWMRDWQERMKRCSFNLVEEGLIARNEPGDKELRLCRELGIKLAGSI
ncbi:MAG: Flavodoxin [Dehalococcoidia bacterium]|nr:Flavodoxin [Chloroflexota bacterium]MBT9162225.1 Flavodoxin [Chloroflexota bacterium]